MSKNKFIAYENVFDQSTLRGLFKMSGQGIFDEIKSPVKIGKESNVFTVESGDELRIVKVYRTAANFKKMFQFMKCDPRFEGVGGSKLTVIYAWARKEHSNLLRARKGGVNVPTPYAYFKNIICMEYIGGKEVAPVLLKKKPKDPKKFYRLLLKEMKKLHKSRLVHTDLSEYNILNFNEKPVLIDFSQAVDLRYPNCEVYLQKDVKNVVNFFNKLGLSLDWEKEFAKVVK